MDVLSLFSQVIIILGVTLTVMVVAAIVVEILLFILIISLIKKHPKTAFFALLLLVAVGIAGSFNPVTVAPALVAVVGAAIVIIKEYKRLKVVLR